MRRLLALALILAALPAQAMDTVLTARANGMQGNGLTRYFGLHGSAAAFTAAEYGYTWMPAAGTLSEFNFMVTVAPSSGQQTDFTIYKNGSSEITFSISGTSTTAAPAGTITVAAGDYLYVQAVGSVTSAGADVLYYCTFTSTTGGQSLVTGGSGSSTNSSSANRYCGLMGVSTWSATANDMRQCMPTGGTFSHLYVSDNTALTSGSYAINLYVNGSATALTASLTSAGTTASDVSHSVNVSAGDLVSIECVPTSPNATKRIQWGLRWTPTTDGESVLLGGSSNDLTQNLTEYNPLNTSGVAWTTTEANFQILWPAVMLKDLYVATSGAPGASPNSWTFTVRDDGSDTAITLTIGEGQTSGNDTAHTATPSAGSLIALQCAQNSVPDANDGYWGIVAYIEPPEPPASSRRVMVIE